MMMSDPAIKRPSSWLTLLELPRAAQEMALLAPAHLWLKSLPGGDGQPVIVIPGFSANNATTMILRYYLRSWGYTAEPWQMGTNVNALEMNDFDDMAAFKDQAVALMCEHLRRIYEETGEKVTLIGWSLGGIFARVIASEAQAYTQQVITLGSPFGDPRGVIIYPLLARLKRGGMSAEDMQAWMAMCNAPLGTVTMTNLYSRTDGFVPSDIAHNINHQWQEAIHVFSSHVGFAINPLVLYLIARRLYHQPQQWQPMLAKHPLERWLFSLP